MDLIKCEKCGESYHPSYKRCPFCQETEHPERVRRSSGIGKKKKKDPSRNTGRSARGAMAVTLAVVLVILSFYLFGDRLLERFRPATPPDEPDPSQEVVPPERNPDDPFFDPENPGVTDPQPPEPTPDPNVDVSNARLNREDFTLSGAGTTFQMELSGTEARPVWSIEDEKVATVSDTGLVTTVANGDTRVFAKVGERTLECIVRVRNAGSSAAPGPAPSTSNASLSSTDFTAKPGDKVQLRVRGTDSAVTWSSENNAVATVSADGLVTCVGRGTIKVYAEVDGTKLQCIVRVK